MNFSMIRYTIGWLLVMEGAFFLVPLIAAIAYGESASILAFALLAFFSTLIGVLLSYRKPRDKKLYQREGLVICALSWIVLSLVGALPFIITGVTPSYIDALFETVSGFTTTGSTIFGEVESLPRAILLWRSFTHWIGGMGVLVFMLAILPLGGGQSMHIMRAESPGPSVSKLVPKVRQTAMILYSIYFAMTVLQLLLLMIVGKESFFDALNIAFATAGTGGFGFKNDSMLSFSATTQIITTVFMLLFSVNFSSYYLLLRGRLRDAFNTELRVFAVFVVLMTGLITLNILGTAHDFSGWEETLRHVGFTVASLVSSTGFSTVDFNLWPELSRFLLVLLMLVGACAGSTGGGLKMSRIIILAKGMLREFKMLLHPRQVKKLQMDGHTIDHEVVRTANAYIVTYVAIAIVSMAVLSVNGLDLTSNFTATVATLNNIGPGLNMVGPTQNFGFLSIPSKLMLIFNMLAGRLELFPLLVLLSPSTYKRS